MFQVGGLMVFQQSTAGKKQDLGDVTGVMATCLDFDFTIKEIPSQFAGFIFIFHPVLHFMLLQSFNEFRRISSYEQKSLP